MVPDRRYFPASHSHQRSSRRRCVSRWMRENPYVPKKLRHALEVAEKQRATRGRRRILSFFGLPFLICLRKLRQSSGELGATALVLCFYADSEYTGPQPRGQHSRTAFQVRRDGPRHVQRRREEQRNALTG